MKILLADRMIEPPGIFLTLVTQNEFEQASLNFLKIDSSENIPSF